MQKAWRAGAFALLLALGVSGCATTTAPSAALAASAPAKLTAGQRADPWENWNRKVFGFNESLDEHVLKPVAKVYRSVVPEMARTGVDNFFRNFDDAWSAVNNLLQGKFKSAWNMTLRVAANTTFGLAGLVDVAVDLGLESEPEDFGQTLGRWGMPAGPYVVWPLLGSSTIRESLALPLDRSATPALLLDNGKAQASILGLQLVNKRATLLGATGLIDGIALDKYSFVRDAYLARRRSLLSDGDEPVDSADDDVMSTPPVAAPAPASAASAAAPASAPAAASASASAPAAASPASAPASAAVAVQALPTDTRAAAL